MIKANIKITGKNWNMLIVNKKDTTSTSLTSFWCLIVHFELISQPFLVFQLLTLNS